MNKHQEIKLGLISICILTLLAIGCFLLGYPKVAGILSILPICLIFLWFGIQVGLSGRYSKEDIQFSKKRTEVN